MVLAAIEFAVLAVLTAWLVRFFAAPRSPRLALATVFVSWYLGFFGTLFLPIDIAEAYYSVVSASVNVTQTCTNVSAP